MMTLLGTGLALLLPLFAPASAQAGDHVYSFKVTNSTARKLRLIVDCGATYKVKKIKFPGSKGRTKKLTASCSSPHFRFEAKVLTKWKKVIMYYPRSTSKLTGKNAVTVKYPLYIKSGLGASNIRDDNKSTTSTSKICIYAFELIKVKAFPRKCK
jgi:hypothetical protein